MKYIDDLGDKLNELCTDNYSISVFHNKVDDKYLDITFILYLTQERNESYTLPDVRIEMNSSLESDRFYLYQTILDKLQVLQNYNRKVIGSIDISHMCISYLIDIMRGIVSPNS